MTKPIGWILIVVVPCLFIIGSDVFKLVKNSKDNIEEASLGSDLLDESEDAIEKPKVKVKKITKSAEEKENDSD